MAANNLKGLTIEIGGDTSNLTTALKDVNKEISSLQSNLRTVNSALRLDPGNIDALRQKQSLLTQAIEQTTQKLETLKEAQRQADEQMANGVEVDQQAYRSLQSEIIRAEASLNDYNRQLGSVTDELDQMSNSTEDASDNTQDLGDGMDDASDSADDLSDSVEDAAESADDANDGFTVWKGTLANLAADVIRNLVSACKDLAKEVVEVGMSFEKSLSKVEALSGATAEEMDQLEEKARALGASTQFSASEVADGFSYMALAGWKTSDMLEGIDGMLNLAAASGMDLAEASDIVTDYLSAFGLEASESARMADLLAYAQGNANTTVSQLSEAFRNSAANMNAAGQDIETTTSLLAMMANQGLKGSEAGTALTAMMRDLTAKMEDGQIAIGETNVQVMDANGNYRDMTDILTDVEAATQGMGDAERAAALSSTFTADSIRGLNLILNAGVDEAAKFEEELRNSGGTAEEVAAIMQDNLTGDITTMKSAFEELALKLYDQVQPALRSMVQFITGSIVPALTWVIDNLPIIGTAIAAIIATIVAYQWANIITFIANVGKAIAGLFTMLAANPIGLVVAAVGALAVGLVALISAADKSGKAIKENAENVTAFGDAVAAAEPIVGDMSSMLSEYGRSLSEIDAAISETENAVTTILATALSEQRQLRDDEIASIKEHNEKLKALQDEKLNMYREAMTVEIMKITAESQTLSQEQVAQYMANMQASLDQASAASEERYNAQLAQIYNYHKTQGTLNSEAYQKDIADAQAAYNQELADSQAFYNQGLSELQSHANQWVSTDAEKWNKVISNTNTSKGKYKAALAEINLDNANAFMSMYTTTVQKGGEISEETAQIASDMIAAFDDLPKGMQEAGKDALLGIIAGLEDEIPALENASEMSAQEIVDTLKSELQINSPSRVTQGIGANVSEGLQSGMDGKKSIVNQAATGIAETIVSGLKSKDGEMNGVGANMVEGVEAGMQSKKSWIGGKISSFASGLVSSFKKAFDINSPSRVMRDQIGKMLPEGIGEGIEENADSALDPLDTLKNDLTAFDGLSVEKSINVNGSAQNGVQRLTAEINSLRALIENYLPDIAANAKKNIYLDKRRLVGELAPDMDDALGDIASRRAVGAV